MWALSELANVVVMAVSTISTQSSRSTLINVHSTKDSRVSEPKPLLGIQTFPL